MEEVEDEEKKEGTIPVLLNLRIYLLIWLQANVLLFCLFTLGKETQDQKEEKEEEGEKEAQEE